MLKRLLPALPQVGRMPYFWLCYLGIFYLPLVLKPASAWPWLGAALATLVFLSLYFRSFYLSGRRLVANALAMSALGVLAIPVSTGASVFFTFSACSCAGLARNRDGWLLIGANVAIAGLAGLMLKPEPGFWIPAMAFPVIVGVPVLYMAAMGRGKQALLRKQEEVEQLAKIAERERIARDMHDVLGHTLSVVALKSELARRLIARDPQAAAREIAEVEQTAREALKQVREAITGYRSAGLAFELAQARKVLEAADIAPDFEVDELQLPPAVENVLALSLREAVTNILRHAKARRCRIALRREAEGLRGEIADDGPVTVPVEAGNGLAGMRERLEALDGWLRTQASPQGFRLTLWLPLPVATTQESPA